MSTIAAVLALFLVAGARADQPDGAYESGSYPNPTPCPVADLPSALRDPGGLGEWVVEDELCYDRFPRRKASMIGSYVLWKDTFKGMQPHLTLTEEDSEEEPEYDDRVAGGFVSMAFAQRACCDGWWGRGFHLEDGKGRSERCEFIKREHNVSTWFPTKVTDTKPNRAGTPGGGKWTAEFHATDGSLKRFRNDSGTWTWNEGDVHFDVVGAADLPVAVQLDEQALGFEYPYEREYPPHRLMTPAARCNPLIATSDSAAYRDCVEALKDDDANGKIKIAIVPLYFTTTPESSVDVGKVRKFFAGGADEDASADQSSTFAKWWRDSSFARMNEMELDVFAPVPINLPEYVFDSEASAKNVRSTSDACAAEAAAYKGQKEGFASEAARSASSKCDPALDCVRATWTRGDDGARVYGYENVAYDATYTCVDLVGKERPGGGDEGNDVAMTGVLLRHFSNGAEAYHGLTASEPAYACVDDTNFVNTNHQHLVGSLGSLAVDPAVYHRVVFATWRTRCTGYGGSGHYNVLVDSVWKQFGSSMTIGTTTWASLGGDVNMAPSTPYRLGGNSRPSDYVNPKGSAGTFIHELVHSFGVKNHARACSNDVKTHLGANVEYAFWTYPCVVVEYGSPFSVIGKSAGSASTHVHAGSMYDMHLLHKDDIEVITRTGTYVIKPLNALTTSSGDKRAAVVQYTDQYVLSADVSDWTKIMPPIWVEFRVAQGVDKSLDWSEYAANQEGIFLNWGHQYGDVLLDLRFGVPDDENSASTPVLRNGDSFVVNQWFDGVVVGDVTFSDVSVASDKAFASFKVTYSSTGRVANRGGEIKPRFYAGSSPYPATKFVTYPTVDDPNPTQTYEQYADGTANKSSEGAKVFSSGVTRGLLFASLSLVWMV